MIMTVKTPGLDYAQLSFDFTSCDLSCARVLLVDDNKMNILVAASMLKKWNAIVDTCNRGEDAVQLAWRTNYTIILMDIEMPDIDGFEATRLIRLGNSRVPVIALSAHTYEEICDKMNTCGMNDMVSKPFKDEQLFSVVKKNIA
jgi:CheY-like chemotaxis protein